MEPRIARRAALSALAVGIVADLMFDRNALGINMPLFTAAVLAIVTFFGRDRRPADPLDGWLPALALVASCGPALRTDQAVVALDLLLVTLAVAAWGFAVGGVAVTRRSAAGVALLGAKAAAAIGVGFLWLLSRAGADGAFAEGSRNLGRLSPMARGGLVAIPIVTGFGILLTSADAVFGRAVDAALHLPLDANEVLGRGAFAVFAAALVAGPLAIAGGLAFEPTIPAEATGDAPEPPGGPLAPATDGGPATAPGRRVGATETLVVLVAVDVLFALFAVVQVVYLFGGADTLAAIGVTYSDYARQGYFQLVGVVGLAGLLLLGAHEIAGRSRAFLVAALTLLGLTAVILASAAVRLELYQGAYGWTELRFFVAASIGWLAACVALAIMLLAGNRMRWLPHGLAMSAAAVTLVVSALGPQAFVMHQNLARVLDPSLVAPGGHAGLDLDYGITLGDDAIPDLVAALAVIPTPEGSTLRTLLRRRRDELDQDASSSGPLSWNLARERAREALATVALP